MGNDMFNDEQLAHLKDRADETERLRLALAEAHARIADLENPDFVNCDGLHADGKYPNTPHRPIGINRLYPCPACTAERERDEARLDHHNCADKGRRLEARLATVLDERDAALALSRARETDGAVSEAALRDEIAWLQYTTDTSPLARLERVRVLYLALSSPPRPETKDDALHATPESERACVVCDTDVCEHIAARLPPPADAATEAATEALAALSSPPRPETKAPRECGGRCHDAIDSRSPCLECAAEMHGPELVPRPAPPADAATEAVALVRRAYVTWQNGDCTCEPAYCAHLGPVRAALDALVSTPAPAPEVKP